MKTSSLTTMRRGPAPRSPPRLSRQCALVIQAMEQQGTKWKYDSADQPRYVKMLLCATASETNAKREGPNNNLNPPWIVPPAGRTTSRRQGPA